MSSVSPLKAKKEASSTKLDWFSGVLVPVLLNIVRMNYILATLQVACILVPVRGSF